MSQQNLNDSVPAPLAGYVNVTWQGDNSNPRNISACVPLGGGVAFVIGEVVTFSGTSGTLANTPTTGTVALYRNGMRQQGGAGNDYTISGATITLAVAAGGSDVFLSDYQH